MASLTAIPLAAIAFTLLFILALVSLACGITLLVIKVSNKNGNQPKYTLVVSVFLIFCAAAIITSVIFYITSLASLLGNYLGGM